jgi:beta-lactam-binding protein with PASTA domain
MVFNPLGFALGTVQAQQEGVTDPSARNRVAFLGGLINSPVASFAVTSAVARQEAQDATAPDGTPPISGSKPLPKVTGLTLEIAKELLGAPGLELQVDPVDEISLEIRKGQITRQVPAEGTLVSARSRVTLFVSQGFPMPNVVKLSIEEAKQELEALGLKVGDPPKEAPSDQIEKGLVKDQEPAAGHSVSKGDTVTLTVSQGIPQIKLPNLVGEFVQEARESVQDLDLRSGLIDAEKTDDTKEIHEVLEQVPAPDTEVAPESLVKLTINPLVLRDFTGEKFRKVREELHDFDVRVRRIEAERDPDKEKGTIVHQNPPAGSKVAPESLVILTVNPPADG